MESSTDTPGWKRMILEEDYQPMHQDAMDLIERYVKVRKGVDIKANLPDTTSRALLAGVMCNSAIAWFKANPEQIPE